MEGSRESQGDRRMPTLSFSRRRFLATVAAAPAALGPRPARGATAVKIGTAVLGDYSMVGPVVVARERGLFKREGLAAEVAPLPRGPDLLKAGMAGRGPLRPRGPPVFKNHPAAPRKQERNTPDSHPPR